MGYGSTVLELRPRKQPQGEDRPVPYQYRLLVLIAEMLDRAYDMGIEEGLTDLRTVRLNLKGHPKMLRNFIEDSIKRLTERLSPEEQKVMAARFGDKPKAPKKARRR